MRTIRAAAGVLVWVLAVGGATGGCSSTTGPTHNPSTPASGNSARAASVPAGPVYAAPGPYTAGLVTLRMNDTLVDVWYPADKGTEAGKPPATYQVSDWLPAALKAKVPPGTASFTTNAYRGLPASTKGPFPLVLFSHGFGGYRDQSSFLTTHLATWGFVVAAPDVLSRGLASVFNVKPAVPMTDTQVLRATVDLLKAQNAQPDGPLNGRVAAGKLAIVGHSAGGFDAIHFGAEPDVATYVPLAAGTDARAADSFVAPNKPSLYMAGADDTVVEPAAAEAAYAASPAPKSIVTIAGSGHLAFTDICLIGTSQGGLTAIARSLGIPIPLAMMKLATDGCGPAALPVRSAYPVVDHFVVAHLRSVFGIDAHPVGLGDDVASTFAPASVTYRHSP